MGEETRNTLLESVGIEESNYNWMEVTKIYKKLAESYLQTNLYEAAVNFYKKLGYSYIRAAEIADSANEYIERYKCAIKAFSKGKSIFAKLHNKNKELECEAEVFLIKGFIANSIVDAKHNFSKSYNLLIKISENYSKADNQEDFGRILSRAANALYGQLLFITNVDEIKAKIQECRDLLFKSLKKIKEVQIIVELLSLEFYLTAYEILVIDFKWDGKFRDYVKEALLRSEAYLGFVEDYSDLSVRGLIYTTVGNWYGFYGAHILEDEIEQRMNIKKGLSLIESGLEFAQKAKDKYLIFWSIFSLTLWASQGGILNYIQERLSKDFIDAMKIGRIYENTVNRRVWYVNFLPANYYSNLAQRSFFTPVQRKEYAEKAIKYSQESLKISSVSPSSTYSYQILTWAYSQLTSLSKSKEEQEINSKKMLDYAKKAYNIAEKSDGGMIQAQAYSCLFKAYSTLSDIAENEDKRIDNLNIAIDAQQKYINHAMESRTGSLPAYIRLGLLYEKLSISTGKTDILIKAKKIYQYLLKESSSRGYYSYRAFSYEYLARIEDRLGNYSLSAELYEKAQKSYIESLKTIEYKPLKNRINEKISYTNAWSLIEHAKSYHKSEYHEKAKENYEKANVILKELPAYNYEATYYSSWASQEEAELFSIQEMHLEAIKSFEKTINGFSNSSRALEKNYKKSKDKIEKERIEKLIKVAEIRIEHCSARKNLEEARILGKQGEHIVASEKFALAASKFKNICILFKIKSEQEDLEAVYFLCKAWENMELAERYEDPKRFSKAATLFTSASRLFTNNKMRLLASGNSNFCQALEYGSKFDETVDANTREQLYTKIKLMLRNAATSYRKGGFEGGADWALGTSIYFDAIWNLSNIDKVQELVKKRELIEISIRYLKSAAELFGKNDYLDKEREVLEHIEIVKKEEKILISALNAIKKPSISRSTIGIVAPSCPIETSLSPKISEVRRFTEESTQVIERIKEKQDLEKIELVTEDPLLLIIMDKDGATYFSISFKDSWKYDDLFSPFMSAFNSFSTEIFSRSIDRIKIGENTILIKPLEPFLVCYVIRGKSYLAQQKLTRFSEAVKEKADIWNALAKSTKTSEVLGLNNPPSLGAVVKEIFD